MPQKKNPSGPSPEALAAFYRLRSESLRNSHTTTQEQTQQMNRQVNQPKPEVQQPMGIVEYVLSALAGHPGVRK